MSKWGEISIGAIHHAESVKHSHWACTLRPFFFGFYLHSTTAPSLLQCATESASKRQQTVRRKQGEHDWNGLSQTNRAGNGSAAEDHGGEEAKFHAVGLAICKAIASEAVCRVVSGQP